MSDYVLACNLINSISQLFHSRDEYNDPELIRLDWQNAGFNPQTDVYIITDPQGNPAGFTEVWMIILPPVQPSNRIFVRPEYLTMGIWEYLLEWAENRSRAALELVPTDLRVAARTSADHTNHAALQATQKLGWVSLRSFYRMETDLASAPELPPAPEGILIRPYNPETETEAVYRAFVNAFRDHFGNVVQPFETGFAEFKHNFIDDPGYDPTLFFVAMQGDQIIGISLCRLVDMEDPGSGRVNELGVLRPWRKRGLGFLLLKHSFAAFYKRGQRRASLYVDATSLTGAVKLYQRVGMHVANQIDAFEKELRPGREYSTRVIS